MNIFETIADDFATNAEIERHLEPLGHENRVMIRDGLEAIKQTGIVGMTRTEWIERMRQLHPVDTQTLQQAFTQMLHLFPFLIQKGMGDSYHWSMKTAGDEDIDTTGPLAQAAGMQIRLTGEILSMMKEGPFTVEDIASRITAVPHSMAVMLVQHVMDSSGSTIRPLGGGSYEMIADQAPKTPSENMSFWRDLAARGIRESYEKSDYYQMGYNDASEGREYEERPNHFSAVQWLDYLDGVKAALDD